MQNMDKILVLRNFINYSPTMELSRDTGNIGYTRHRLKTNNTEQKKLYVMI